MKALFRHHIASSGGCPDAASVEMIYFPVGEKTHEKRRPEHRVQAELEG